jgi:Trypsin-like peptidase domain
MTISDACCLLGVPTAQAADRLIADLAIRHRAPVGPTIDEVTGLARSAIEKMESMSGVLSPEEYQALEYAISLLRPVIQVTEGRPGPLPDAESTVFSDWDSFRATSTLVLASVALVRGFRLGEPGMRPIATAFTIRPGLAITNRHVVEWVTRGTGSVMPDQLQLEFGAEIGSRGSHRAAVRAVRALHTTLDLALLETEPDDIGQFGHLALTRTVLPIYDPVVVVGFPQWDSRNPSQVSQQIGRGAVVVKRASPGLVRTVHGDLFRHDATTLGGNSGSPIVRIRDHQVVGIHAGGMFLASNEAIAAGAAASFAETHGGR